MGKLVEIRGLDLPAKAPDIRPAKVVCNNYQEIGPFCRHLCVLIDACFCFGFDDCSST
jgi:hypothetical protein